MRSILLLLFFVCNTIQAGKGTVKREIKEEEVEESSESRSTPGRRLDKDQQISMYSRLYRGIIVEKEGLRVPSGHLGLGALCRFFDSCNTSERLSGEPGRDADLIKECYDEIKNILPPSYQDRLPICDRIVTAIKETATRWKEGEKLLKPFLGRKNAIPEKIKEEEVEESSESRSTPGRRSGKNKQISMYSRLYRGIIVEKEGLHVRLTKHAGLGALCSFFDSCNASERLSGEPGRDAALIEEHYDEIKNILGGVHQKKLPRCARIVTAIKEAATRWKKGEELLKPFLSKKRAKPEKIKEEEVDELLKPFLSKKRAKPEKIKEEEADESSESSSIPAERLGKDQQISMYSRLYRGIIVKKEGLHVRLAKHAGLGALCSFFDSCHASRRLSGDPGRDAALIEEHYDDIKNTLLPSCQDRLPICDRIVTAIKGAETRWKDGGKLLKPFLGRKNAIQEKIKEEEADESSSMPGGIKEEEVDEPGYILKKEAELD